MHRKRAIDFENREIFKYNCFCRIWGTKINRLSVFLQKNGEFFRKIETGATINGFQNLLQFVLNMKQNVRTDPHNLKIKAKSTGERVPSNKIHLFSQNLPPVPMSHILFQMLVVLMLALEFHGVPYLRYWSIGGKFRSQFRSNLYWLSMKLPLVVNHRSDCNKTLCFQPKQRQNPNVPS